MSSAIPPEPAASLAIVEARPGTVSLEDVAEAAAGCRACALWERATQTVFGKGPAPARLMLVGEQPGDREDLAGEPFVGPAGRILNEALAAAGIDRETVFVTNVVKHFKWRPAPGSKRRLHERPNRVEVGACFPWLESELALVRPEALVLLGATAAGAVLGPSVRVTRDHGRRLASEFAPFVTATIHPSAVLRANGAAARREALAGLIADFRAVKRVLAEPAAAAAPTKRSSPGLRHGGARPRQPGILRSTQTAR
jgi:uracil-DNA glycosylase family protein